MEKQRWEESENILKSQCEKHTTIFWKLRCRKSLRRCGRSKREKHSTLEALLDVQRHHTRLQLQHYTTSHYIQQLWVRWPLNHFQKAQLQPPFGPSADSLSHPCITKIHPSHGFLSSKLPPPPCAVLLVLFTCGWYIHIYIYIYYFSYIHTDINTYINI